MGGSTEYRVASKEWFSGDRCTVLQCTVHCGSSMWLPQGGALKIENLQFTQYSIIMLLSPMLHLILSLNISTPSLISACFFTVGIHNC